ncbi:hypothetical protein WDZ92_19625, partial [Nostoc sp. NIES-2111]
MPARKRRVAAHIRPADVHIRKQSLDVLDVLVADREFGTDDPVDDNGAQCGPGVEVLHRPLRPGRIVLSDIEQDIGVDQDQPESPRVSAMISSVLRCVVAVPR